MNRHLLLEKILLTRRHLHEADVTLTQKSGNIKVGPIPVSTSHSGTCPSTCPFAGKGCYAKSGPTRRVWDSVDKGELNTVAGPRKFGTDWDSFTKKIGDLPQGQLWRHNQAGDLPGKDINIDNKKLDKLVQANKGKRGFTYTHKPVIAGSYTGSKGEKITVPERVASQNRNAVKKANKAGFTINISATGVKQADQYKKLGIGPVVTTLPVGSPNVIKTPGGNTIVKCPAQHKENVTCASCGLCSRQERNIVGFEAHGNAKKHVSNLSSSPEIQTGASTVIKRNWDKLDSFKDRRKKKA